MLSLAFLILGVDALAGDEVSESASTSPIATEANDVGKVSVSMRSGGIGRFVANRWGTVLGKVSNLDDQPASSLIVVTPSGSGGQQFARRITVPPRVAFDTSWPVRISTVEDHGNVDFQYLFFPDGKEDGVIRHEKHDREIPSFSGVTQRSTMAVTGLMGESGPDRQSEYAVHQLMAVMRHSSGAVAAVAQIIASDLTTNVECLDPLDQLAICDSQLVNYPQACDSIRLWLQRGGRLLITLDRTGLDVAEALLGDSLPMTLAGETSTNEVTLEINPEYSQTQYPVRSVNRQFPEPIRYLRVLPGSGETIWSVDGWPVAIRKEIGRGVVVVTTISSEVFMEPNAETRPGIPAFSMIASSRRILESFFSPHVPPLISEAAASDAAAALVGYQIPSRNVALMLLIVFPVCLIVAGLFFQRRAQGERLVVALPCLAILAALPVAAIGYRIRSVAPETIIETAVIQSSPGFSEYPADGFVTAFVPAPTELQVSSQDSAKLDVLADATNSDYRRLVWDGPHEISWMRLKQPAGLRTYSMSATQSVRAPSRAFATFDETGIRGTIQSDTEFASGDAILAGINHENLAISIAADGSFRADAVDLLAAGQFFRTNLLSDEQLYRAKLLKSVFTDSVESQLGSFPTSPSILFWDESEKSSLLIGGDGIRRKRNVLVVQPLELLSPEAGKPFAIPAALLSYRSVPLANGGMSSVFSNIKMQWQPQESPAQTLLEFTIPDACRPFDPETAELELLIRAGSRMVTIQAGGRDNLQTVSELRSPLGSQSMSIPADAVRATCLTGKLYLLINVSGLDSEIAADDMTGEQDDSWRIERALLSLKGRRQP